MTKKEKVKTVIISKKGVKELLEEEINREALLFHTFIYWREYMSMLYVNVKITFENIQIVLSQNPPLGQFLRVLLENSHKIPTDEPIWKRMAKIHTEISS